MTEAMRRPENEFDTLTFKDPEIQVPRVNYSFEIPPEPIPASKINRTVTTEVLVIGGGLAGTAASISAVEAGAKVSLIEMMTRCQARGRDNAFVNSRLQKKLGIEIDKDELVLEIMKLGANRPDQRLLRLWAYDSGATADWLMKMTDASGLEVKIVDFPPPATYNNATEYYPYYLVTHRYVNETLVIKCLMENAQQKGVDFHFRTRARQLLRERGRVTGVIAQNVDGEYIQYNADKAVILCTGDYSNNPEMMAKFCPQAYYLKTLLRTSTGDGHKMGLWVGAVMETAPHSPMTHGFPGPLGTDAFLQVNIKGERFQNEDVCGQSYTNQVEHQPGQTAWQVFDAKYLEELPRMGIGFMKVSSPSSSLPGGFRSKPEVIADTVEELAEKMGVPVETFKVTVARYNQLVRLGKDLDFSKRYDRLTTIEKPPFYAGRGRYTLLAVMGGLNVNTKMQALDKDWEPIPGLYLAGNTMGNRFGVVYPIIAPGISHGMALHYGYLAGRNAATLEP